MVMSMSAVYSVKQPCIKLLISKCFIQGCLVSGAIIGETDKCFCHKYDTCSDLYKLINLHGIIAYKVYKIN